LGKKTKKTLYEYFFGKVNRRHGIIVRQQVGLSIVYFHGHHRRSCNQKFRSYLQSRPADLYVNALSCLQVAITL